VFGQAASARAGLRAPDPNQGDTLMLQHVHKFFSNKYRNNTQISLQQGGMVEADR
jgi:hypothetical protein